MVNIEGRVTCIGVLGLAKEVVTTKGYACAYERVVSYCGLEESVSAKITTTPPIPRTVERPSIGPQDSNRAFGRSARRCYSEDEASVESPNSLPSQRLVLLAQELRTRSGTVFTILRLLLCYGSIGSRLTVVSLHHDIALESSVGSRLG